MSAASNPERVPEPADWPTADDADSAPKARRPADSVAQASSLWHGPGTKVPDSVDPKEARRADVDEKHALVADLLLQEKCDGLLVFERENFAWLTGGDFPYEVLDPDDAPVLLYRPDLRWVLAGNVDSQRLFDVELDGLGFQLKEWFWGSGRDRLLAEICRGRRLAADRSVYDCPVVAERLQAQRRRLTRRDRACIAALGRVLAHALEATCRTMHPGESEREIAGQMGHRLLHHGARPVAIQVAGDDRLRIHRRRGATDAIIRHCCVVSACASKYGLHLSASRSVHFGRPDLVFQKEHDAACKVAAAYVASSWPDAVPAEILHTGRRVYTISEVEHEWRLHPPGFVTGRAPVELAFKPHTRDLLESGWAVAWCASVGGALSWDSYLVADDGPQPLTPTERWPNRRIRISGQEIDRPALLVR